MIRIGSLVFGRMDMATNIDRRRRTEDVVNASNQERKVRQTNACWKKRAFRSRRLLGPACNLEAVPSLAVHPCPHGLAMNSPLEPASPDSSSSESLTDDISQPQDYSAPPASEKSEKSSFLSNPIAFAKNVAKRRLPGGSTKTTSNRDSKARRREGNHRKGGQLDRRDNAKAKDDLLDVALFEDLKRSMQLIRLR
jgi:hypothetical protein